MRAGLETVTPTRALVQETPGAVTCNPNDQSETKVSDSMEQARIALNAKDGELAARALQEGLSIALQLRSTQTQTNLIKEWLLDDYEGYSASRLQRLMQQTDLQPLVLAQFLQLTNRLTTGNSFVKTRALAAIARQYEILNQPQQAKTLLNQARQASRFIQGAIFSATALIDIAEGYAAIAQTQLTHGILTQVEQALTQFPANGSESIKVTIWERMAATYARVGDYAKAQQFAARFPKESEARAIALRGIVEAYITAQKLDIAEQLIEAITAPSQKVPTLGQLAVAYNNAKQFNKAMQLLGQAVQLAQSSKVAHDSVLQESLLKELVKFHLQVGRRDEASRLTMLLKTSQTEPFKAVIVAYRQAGQTTTVKQLLSNRLRVLRGSSQPWSQPSLGELLQIAVAAQQFDWIRDE